MPDGENIIVTPLQLYQEIEAAQSIDSLRALSMKMLDTVRCVITAAVDTKSIVQLISRINCAITRRLIILLESSEGISLPDGATFLALGSEGRGEQTLRTDQDSAIVYLDDLSSEKLGDVRRFATRIVDGLEAIGVPRCPGNVMASNPQWCHSVREWKRLLEEWITIPTPEHMLDFCMFQDLRSLHGNENLCTELCDHIRTTVRLPPFFFPNMACHATRFPSPITMFGRIRLEPRGEQRGRVEIKKSGIFAITVGVSLLALDAGVIGGNTWDKLTFLGRRGVLTAGDLKTVEAAFSFLVRLRIQWQLRELSANKIPTNYVDPQSMTRKELDQFRAALKGVDCFLRIVRNRYQLDFISH